MWNVHNTAFGSKRSAIYVISGCITYKYNTYKLYKHLNSSTVRCTFFADRVVNTWNKFPHPRVDFNSLTSFKRTLKMFTLLSFSFDFSFDFIVDFTVDLVLVLLIFGIICICHILGCVSLLSCVLRLVLRSDISADFFAFLHLLKCIYTVSQKTKQICFCQNYVKFPPILIIFGRKMRNDPNICEVHSFSTSPNLRRNWWKFDEVLTKTNLLSFLGHGVLLFCVANK